jgi:hypothetical protein
MLKISPDDTKGKGKERAVGDDDDLGMSALSVSRSAPASTTAAVPVPSASHQPLTLDVGGSHGEKVEGEEEWVEEVTDEELDYEIITVKIADLGNGSQRYFELALSLTSSSQRLGRPTISPTTSRRDNIDVPK